MLLPIYRADAYAEERYVLPFEQIFNCGGTVIVGKTEQKKAHHYADWQRYFSKPIQIYEVKGGHFYIQESPRAFAKILNETLERI